MSEVRKWEDLEYDCLVNILGRVGMSSLLLDVPFVCKSWYKVSLNPSYWHHIDIPKRAIRGNVFHSSFVLRFIDAYQIKKFSIRGFVDLISSRGLTSSASFTLSSFSSYEDLLPVAMKCSELKSLSLKCSNPEVCIPMSLGKLKQLEELRIDFGSCLRGDTFCEIVDEIGRNCENVNSLIISNGQFRKVCAEAISNFLPQIKNLSIKHCHIEQKNLEIVLSGCKDLEYLDVSDSKYSGIWDEKRLKELGSHIKTFNLAASPYSGLWGLHVFPE